MSFSEYVRAGFSICAIPPNSKGPTYPNWNTQPIAEDAADGLDGAGLLHALSGTCCLDVDNLEAARKWLADKGVDIDALLEADNAVQISSGRPNRAKLLYRMKRPLRTLKPKGSGLELRCATADGKSVQDVLPPSIHPETKKPYIWAGGLLADWQNPPSVPAALLTLWRGLTAGEPATPAEPTYVDDRPRVNLVALRKAAFKHSPDAEYDEWLKVGMQLHDGTGGAQEGFDIWSDWSRKITRKPYPGDTVLKTHWVSFTSKPGKTVASGAALAAEIPAEAEEFPVEPDNPALDDTDTTKAIMEAQAAARLKEGVEELEKRLVFVFSAERYFDCERHRVIGSDNALEHMFTHLMPKRKGGRVSPVKLLKASTTKRFVDAIGFHPGEGVIFHSAGKSFANSYRNELPEPLEPTAEDKEKIEWLFNRIDDTKYRRWLLQFYGHVVQFPGVKIKSAPLIWSDTQGNGKTTLVRMVPSLLVGAAYSREVTSSQLNDQFNGYLLDAWHINLTEFRAGSRGEREAISKKVESWIADDVVAVRPMQQTAYTMPNHFFVTGSSNSDDAAAITGNDRKWAVHELKAPQFTVDEQRWIYQDFLLTPRAAAVLRHYFLNLDLKGFSPSAKALETDARKDMVEASVALDQELLVSAFEQRVEPLSRDIVITQDVTTFVHKHTPAKPSAHRIGKVLSRAPFNGTPIQFRCGVSKYRAVILRNAARWLGANGRDIMAHIQGEDEQIHVDTDDMLA